MKKKTGKQVSKTAFEKQIFSEFFESAKGAAGSVEHEDGVVFAVPGLLKEAVVDELDPESGPSFGAGFDLYGAFDRAAGTDDLQHALVGDVNQLADSVMVRTARDLQRAAHNVGVDLGTPNDVKMMFDDYEVKGVQDAEMEFAAAVSQAIEVFAKDLGRALAKHTETAGSWETPADVGARAARTFGK